MVDIVFRNPLVLSFCILSAAYIVVVVLRWIAVATLALIQTLLD